MKHVQLLAVAAVGLAMAGCAGSGSTASGGTGVTIVTTPRIEAVVSKAGTLLTDSSGAPLIQDPRSFEINMEFTFQLVGYTATGTRVVLSPDKWISSDSGEAYASLAVNSGQIVTKSGVNRDPLTVSAVYNGTAYAAEYDIHPRETILTGSVTSGGTGLGIKDVSVNFYDVNGVLVNTVSTAYNGSFRVSVPANTTTQFQIISDSLPNSFYRSYLFEGFRYNAGQVDCRAQISAYTAGERSLSDVISVTPLVNGQATPPADGCTTP